jgi:hypothetical protein
MFLYGMTKIEAVIDFFLCGRRIPHHSSADPSAALPVEVKDGRL